jgi:hypothetical protein
MIRSENDTAENLTDWLTWFRPGGTSHNVRVDATNV